MFNRHALQMKIVKTTDSEKNEPVEIKLTVSEETANTVVRANREMVKSLVIGAATFAGIYLVTGVIIEGTCALIVHAFDKED